MTFHNFLEKINWRQIIVHFVACWFFIHAFQTLSFLYDTKLVDTIRQSNGQLTSEAFVEKKFDASDLTYFWLWTSVSGFVGLLVAFIISLIISFKRNWLWANTLLAFILAFILYHFHLLGWGYLRQFFWYFGQRFNNSTIEFLLNGSILLTIGTLIFFLRGPNLFIENKKPATV
jgi:hypothetical protein